MHLKIKIIKHGALKFRLTLKPEENQLASSIESNNIMISDMIGYN